MCQADRGTSCSDVLTRTFCEASFLTLQDRLALEGDAEGGGGGAGAGEVERLAAAAAEAGLNAADAAAAAAAVLAAEGAARRAPDAAEGGPARSAPGKALGGAAGGASQAPLAEPLLPAQAAAAEQSGGVPARAGDAGSATGREGSMGVAGSPAHGLKGPDEASEGPDAAAEPNLPPGDAPDAAQGRNPGPGKGRGALPLPLVPPVLETLGKGLRALVAPPGMGRVRELFTADPADPNKTLEGSTRGSVPPSPEPPQSEPAPEAAAEGPLPASVSLQSADALMGVLPPSGVSRSAPASDRSDSHGAADVSHGVAADGAMRNGTPAQPAPAVASDPQAPRLSPPEGPPRASPQAAAPLPPPPAANPSTDDLTLTPGLAGNSAGSARARHSGSVYDALIAEIKARFS